MSLIVPRLRLADNLMMQISKRLMKDPIRLYFDKTEVVTFSMSSGTTTQVIESIGMGKNPTSILLAFQVQIFMFLLSDLLSPT